MALDPEPLPASPPSLADIPWLRSPATQAVFAALAAGGFEARAVGGCVRNALLGNNVTDVDIATTAAPDDVLRLAESKGLKAIATGLQHGTVTVVADHRAFEVTTLRQDVETFGRHAKVAFTSDWVADASRRDFTINALYCSANGVVHDPLGGYGDLLARRVRFIGDACQRIREDYLRILRFFRFFAEYAQGTPDPDGLAACIAERGGLASLSGERLRQELLKLLSAPRSITAVSAMRDHGLLTEVLPIAPRLNGLQRLAAIEAALAAKPQPVLRLAALAIAVDEDADRLADRLRLSNRERAVLLRAASVPRLPQPPTTKSLRALLYRDGSDAWRERILLAWAESDATVHAPAWIALLALPLRWQPPKLPVSGKDLVTAGLAPGPRVGAALRALEAWWIDNDFPTDRRRILDELDRLAQKP